MCGGGKGPIIGGPGSQTETVGSQGPLGSVCNPSGSTKLAGLPNDKGASELRSRAAPTALRYLQTLIPQPFGAGLTFGGRPRSTSSGQALRALHPWRFCSVISLPSRFSESTAPTARLGQPGWQWRGRRFGGRHFQEGAFRHESLRSSVNEQDVVVGTNRG